MSVSASGSPWKTELHHFIHDLAGAFLFGIPSLYTMEVWWRGNTATPLRMLLTLVLTYAALVVIERGAEKRMNRRVSWPRTLLESAQGFSIGIVAATLGLFIIGVLNPESGTKAIIGRIVMEGVPFSLGVGLADFLLGEKEQSKDKGDEDKEPKQNEKDTAHNNALSRIVVRISASALGAIAVALTIAPTQEIPLIANNLTHAQLLGLVAASLLVSYMIVFASNFVTREARDEHGGGFESPFSETIMAYLIALALSAGMVWLYQLVDTHAPLDQWVGYAVVLGLPASIGGAAGRLAV